jgi:hypothetical protein
MTQHRPDGRRHARDEGTTWRHDRRVRRIRHARGSESPQHPGTWHARLRRQYRTRACAAVRYARAICVRASSAESGPGARRTRRAPLGDDRGRWTVATRTAFDIGGEMAGQLGSIGDGPIRARAGHRTVGFTDAPFAWTPRVFAEYNYASAMTTRTMDDGRRSISCTDRPRQARSRRSGGLEERAPSPDWNRSAPGAPPRRHRPVSLVVADNDNRCAV